MTAGLGGGVTVGWEDVGGVVVGGLVADVVVAAVVWVAVVVEPAVVVVPVAVLPGSAVALDVLVGVGVPVTSSPRAAGAVTVTATMARAAAMVPALRFLSMRMVLMVCPRVRTARGGVGQRRRALQCGSRSPFWGDM